MCFADHIVNLLFLSFYIVPIVSFGSYLVLVFKRMHLIQKCVVFKK